MKIYLDRMDENSTPIIYFCCRELFQSNGRLEIVERTDRHKVVLKVPNDFNLELNFCPFCGSKIEVLSNEGQGNG